MSARTYPRKVWVLTPGFTPKEVDVVRKAYSYSPTDWGDEAESGRRYGPDEMFGTRESAITAGHRKLDAQQAKLDKMQATLEKRRAALQKAAEQEGGAA